MERYLEKLQADILQKAFLSDMPDKETEETQLWVSAIALLRKADGNYAYGIIRRNYDMTTKIVVTNGTSSPIAETVEVYPYEQLDRRYLRGFKGNTREPRIEYLKGLNLPIFENTDFSKLSFSDLNKCIVGAAIYMQTQKNK